ncbi:MAG: class I SAM-dependent methyltransferase [Methylococcales bacterium]|nr:class I SAM-dependent methyltransferase [Methylococcales bacterium]
MTKQVSLTSQAHHFIQQVLSLGDIAIDATVGNGYDTLFLAQQVGKHGKVFGFDIQKQAIEATHAKLESEYNTTNLTLIHDSHSNMSEHIPIQFHKKIKAISFNLGYLPGSDKSVITHAKSTLTAVNQSIDILADTGIMTIVAYPGHIGGNIETKEIEQWVKQLLLSKYSIQIINGSEKATSPKLFIIKKLPEKT